MSVCACVDRARARGFTLTTMCISSAPVQRSGRVIMRNCYKAVTCPVCGSATMPYAAEGCAPLIVTASWVVAVAVAFSSACALPHWSPDAEACPQHHGSPLEDASRWQPSASAIVSTLALRLFCFSYKILPLSCGESGSTATTAMIRMASKEMHGLRELECHDTLGQT